ncbi:MAG: ATP-dependent helicase [Firmicutes bacterium]|nr:ATP-dependent helicase [Bacillota bacterium]
MNKLNQEQYQAVTGKEKAILVLAGPGSGKTTMIVHRVAHLLEQGVPGDGILVMTYTKAAAQEMRSRFLRLAGTETTPVRFGTFHSVFWEMLRRRGRTGGLSLLEEDGARMLAAELLADHWEYPRAEAVELAGDLLNALSYRRNTGRPASAENTLPVEMERFAGLYQEAKHATGKLDFDDLLTMTLQMLRNEPQTAAQFQNRWRHVLVDEFQDINPVQYECLKKLAGPATHVFAVGDDDQSIYGFRGAAPGIMKMYLQDFTPCRTITLRWNYRSTPQIVTFSGKIISHNTDRLDKSISASRGDGTPVRTLILKDSRTECRRIAEFARSLARPSDLAILFRSLYDSAELCRTLADYRIPFTIKGETSDPLEHWIGDDLELFFHAACGDQKAFLTILRKPGRGIPMGIMSWLNEETPPEALLHYSMKDEVRVALEELLYHLHKLADERPARAAARIFKQLEYGRALEQEAEKTGIPYREFEKRFRFFTEAMRKAPTWDDWFRLRREGIEQNRGGEEGVRMMTLHASKGLEFPCVWLPQLEKDLLPHARAEDIMEERRLFYVGCTRARDQLVISTSRRRGGGRREASEFWGDWE